MATQGIVLINPNYEKLRDTLELLTNDDYFSSVGTTIYEGRNIVKSMEIAGEKFIVKKFGHISLLNRFVYGLSLRRSKAYRSFLNTQELSKRGIDAPEEVAALEKRYMGRLIGSLYIYKYSDYLSIAKLFENFRIEASAPEVLKSFAAYLVDLHNRGVMHNDLNIGNVLYSCSSKEESTETSIVEPSLDASKYNFQLIDVNRMVFGMSLSKHQRLTTMRRLSCPLDLYYYILLEYSRIYGKDMVLGGFLRWCLFECRVRVKRTIKQFIGKLK